MDASEILNINGKKKKKKKKEKSNGGMVHESFSWNLEHCFDSFAFFIS